MILELYAIFYWIMFILGIWKFFELLDKFLNKQNKGKEG